MNIDYVIMATDHNDLYDGFWEIVSRQWSDAIGITPVLVTIGDAEYIKHESDRVLIGLKKVSNVPTNHQAQIARLYATKLLPSKTILISDLDMYPVSKKYYVKMIENIPEESFFLYTADHYGQSDSDLSFNYNKRCTMCYVAAKSETYNEILDLNKTFEQFVIDLMLYNLGWNTDEIYLGNMLNIFDNANPTRVHKIFRGTEPHVGACLRRRIDREYLSFFDEEKLKNDYYIDFHLPRPYKTNKTLIDDILRKINDCT